MILKAGIEENRHNQITVYVEIIEMKKIIPDRLFQKIRNIASPAALISPTAILTAALILRLLFLVIMMAGVDPAGPIDKFPDPAKYLTAADYLFDRSSAGQYELFLVGIGYPFFLGILMAIFGKLYWLILLFQIALSSYACVIIYKIARLLIKNQIIAVLAGYLAAVSLTSISLSNAILSETLFFFLFVFSLYLFFAGLVENRWRLSIWAGILGGLAILVRSVSILYPGFFIIFAIIFPSNRLAASKKQAIIKSAATALIMIFIASSWGLRNFTTHDTFTVSGTGVLAAKTYLTARVLIEGQGRHAGDFANLRDSLYRVSLAEYEAGNYRKCQTDDIGFITSSIRRYPNLFLKNYFSTILDNATITSSLHYIQLPSLSGFFDAYDEYIHRGNNDPAMLVFSMIGFLVLARKNFGIALILLLNVIYFVFMSGVSFGQGSRLFFPALSTQSILAATAILAFYDLISAGGRLIFSRRQPDQLR